MELTKYQECTVKQIKDVYNHGNRAYIVADEVGLGKTYVAIGLIKEMEFNRIIYIASNGEIARQNVKDMLKILQDFELVQGDRLSVMALNKYDNKKKYIMSLSPATTFTGKGSDFGNEKERNFFIENCQYINISKEEMSNVFEKKDLDSFSEYRAKFNMVALNSFQPDLIIMDEFHRFHSLLDVDGNGMQFNLWKYIQPKESTKEKSDNNSPKILLLSATPYKYNENIENYEVEKRYMEEMVETPFSDFRSLRKYMEKINDINYKDYESKNQGREISELDYLYNYILCRTERGWLIEDDVINKELDIVPVDDCKIKKFIEWKAVWQRECLGLNDEIDTTDLDNEKIKSIINHNFSTKGRILMKKVLKKDNREIYSAIQDYSNIRTYLDETPEYLQFSYGYKTIYKQSSNGGTDLERKIALSHVLSKQNQYRIRFGENNQVEKKCFEKTYGHYKWDYLRENVLPDNSEYLLWVLPLIADYKDSFFTPLIDYSKVLVFARYRMSTRAIAALTSLEIEKRLDEVINGNEVIKCDIGAGTLDELIAPLVEKLKELSDDDKIKLKNAIKKFFGTLHVRKVLTAWGIQNNINELDKIIKEYCKVAKWKEMWYEYIECLNDYNGNVNKKETIDVICSVLGWSDNEYTKIIIMPDRIGNDISPAFTCSFGDRYINDYSDQGSNDINTSGDKKNNEKNNTRKRLEYIRERFQSPFYPFVLAASEVAREGVNLHNYCGNIVHWSAPSSLSAYMQEEGRVDRRCSYIMRKRMVNIYKEYCAKRNKSNDIMNIDYDSFYKLYNNALNIVNELNQLNNKDCCEEKLSRMKENGIFPKWYLPDCEGKETKINTIALFMPMSNDEIFYNRMKKALKNYNCFGVTDNENHKLDAKKLCPYLRNLKID